MTELEKTLKRMRVTIKTVVLIATPARGFLPESRLWRVTLAKNVDEKTIKLVLNMLSKDSPTATEIIKCLIDDTEASELKLWDFAQEFNEGKTDAATEDMHKACKRIGPRIRRFFGNSWPNVVSKVA